MAPERRGEDQEWRRVLDAHKIDTYAHGPMIGRMVQEGMGIRKDIEDRIRSLENWRWWVLGIGALLVFEIPIAVYFVK